ncbi:MAG TPA: flagellar biosynthetic protein FliR [Bdellovibrionales bacterium]|nr:flagellar biosynthetic protein FliR [Bdellovibrionales bacterium]
MLPILNFNEAEILAFALILLRVSAFLVTWPVFSVFAVPHQLKVLFAVLLTMVLFPVINRAGASTEVLSQQIIWLAGKEVLTGICLGFLTRLFFFAVSAGANLIATSAGLANAQLFNPTIGATTTVVEQFYVAVATLLFLSLNGHHIFLDGLVQSFDAIPLTGGIDIAVFKDSGLILQSVVESGIKISAPVMVVVFFLNVAMGIIGRAVPQINVLVTSMPVNFMAGILVMLVGIPAMVFEMSHQVDSFAAVLFKFLAAM